MFTKNAPTKIEYLQRMQQNLIDFENAARRISEEWGNDKDFDIDLNEAATRLYPFDKSFDEVSIDISQWVSDANQRIEMMKGEDEGHIIEGNNHYF